MKFSLSTLTISTVLLLGPSSIYANPTTKDAVSLKKEICKAVISKDKSGGSGKDRSSDIVLELFKGLDESDFQRSFDSRAYSFEMFKWDVIGSMFDGNFNLLHCYILMNLGQEAKDLITNGDIDVNSKVRSGYTALLMAIEGGQFEVAKALLQVKGIDVKAENGRGYSALHMAAVGGDVKVVNALLSIDGVDVNVESNHLETPLHLAAQIGNSKVVKALLKNENIQVNTKEEYFGDTPLLAATFDGHAKVAKVLLEHKDIDVNAKRKSGKTALHKASEYGHFDFVKALLDHKDIDVNAKDNEGKTALDLANLRQGKSNQYDQVIKALKEKIQSQ